MPRSYVENCDNSRVKISLPHPDKSSRRETYPLPVRGGNDEKKQYGTLSEAF